MNRGMRWSLFLGCVVALGLAARGSAQNPADDPFSEANRAEVKPPASKKNDTNPLKLNADPFGLKKADTVEERIDFEVAVSPKQVRRGETVKLTMTGTPRPGFYTYPMTQRTEPQPDGQLAVLTYETLPPGIRPLWPVAESEPIVENIPDLGPHLKHKKKFTWIQDILVLPDAPPGAKKLAFSIRLQVCDETCIIGTLNFDADFEVTDAPAVALTPQLQDRLKVTKQEIKVVTPGDSTPALPGAAPAQAAEKPTDKARDMGVLAFALQGLAWGAISLLTPCVFPMIPITVSFFLKQSEKEHHRPYATAAVYSVTIVTVLTLGGMILIGPLQQFSQHWVTNLVLGALFLVFALSLFGMYDIQLPSSLAQLTSAQEGRGGYVGTMFMALTFTIISFTCVAPFYGGFIAVSASAQSGGDWIKLFVGALSFSVAFAAPFFVLALFPGLLRSMPKSGSWMNTIKVVMGFLELAAALKFLRAGELVLFGEATLLTYDLVLGMYVALSILTGLYLLNLYRLPHDHDVPEQLGVPRLMWSLMFLSLGFYLMPGLFKHDSGVKQRPTGAVFAWLDSFLLPDPEAAPSTGQAGTERGKPSAHLNWIGNLERGLKEAQAQRQLVFIDFTGLS